MCATCDPSSMSTATKVVLATIGTAALLVVATVVNYALA